MTDANDKPLRGQLITIDRTAGPLTELLWPTEWLSDGAGRAFIPTLEIGEHTFHVKADGTPHKVTVPPLPTGVTEVKVKVP